MHTVYVVLPLSRPRIISPSMAATNCSRRGFRQRLVTVFPAIRSNSAMRKRLALNQQFDAARLVRVEISFSSLALRVRASSRSSTTKREAIEPAQSMSVRPASASSRIQQQRIQTVALLPERPRSDCEVDRRPNARRTPRAPELSQSTSTRFAPDAGEIADFAGKRNRQKPGQDRASARETNLSRVLR